MKRTFALLALLCAVCAYASGQSKESEIFAAGGHSVSGGRGDTSVFQAGARFAWRLLPIGGVANLQYAVDVIPVFVVNQPLQSAYGVSFTPFDLKLNVTSAKWHPYAELGGGVLFTTHNVPIGTSQVNFTPQAGVGVQLPFARTRNFLDFEVKYIHISNAGLTVPNPGVNTVQFKLAVGRWGSLLPFGH